MTDKKIERWYDKQEDLSLVMKSLEFADDDVKLAIAADLLQMVMSNRDTNEQEELLEEINEEYIPIKRRWYDQFESLHSAVEMLKYLDADERTEAMKKALNSIMNLKNDGE